MSRFVYGSVEMGFPKTEGITYTPEFDESKVYLWTRVDIVVSGLINPKTMSYEGNPPQDIENVPAGETVASIRSALMQPRQQLIYDFAGEEMISTPAAGASCDVNNGPIPGPFTLTRMDGLKSIACRMSVTTYIIECPGGLTPLALISNTFSQSHGVDQQHRTLMTTTGQALFRTDVLEFAGQLADDYREMLNVPVAKGFRRTNADFVATPSRNALTYRYVDVEQFFDLGDTSPANAWNGGLTGSGIVEADVTRTVSSTGTRDGGLVSFMTMHSVGINLVGNKAASNWRLTQTAYAIASSMLPIGDPQAGYLKFISVFQKVTDRVIGMKVDMMLTPKNVGKIAILEISDLREDEVFPDQGGINPPLPNRNGTAGTYANSLNVSAWKSVCEQPYDPVEGDYDGNTSEGSYSPYTGPIVTATTSDSLPTYPVDYSQSHSDYAYTSYEINTSYPTSMGVLMCPVAGTPQSPGYTPGGGGSGDTSSTDVPDAEFLTVARPNTRVIMEVTASRANFVPQLPDLNQDENLVLLEFNPSFKAPELLPDGYSYMYYASCRYVYGMKRAKKLGDNFNVGAAPYTTQDSYENFYNGENFVDGIGDGQPSDDESGSGGGGDGGGAPADGPPGKVE